MSDQVETSTGQAIARASVHVHHSSKWLLVGLGIWDELYGAAGFRMTSVIPLQDNFGTSIVEGAKA